MNQLKIKQITYKQSSKKQFKPYLATETNHSLQGSFILSKEAQKIFKSPNYHNTKKTNTSTYKNQSGTKGNFTIKPDKITEESKNINIKFNINNEYINNNYKLTNHYNTDRNFIDDINKQVNYKQ